MPTELDAGFYGSDTGYGYALVLDGEALLGLNTGRTRTERLPGDTLNELSRVMHAGAFPFTTTYDGAADGHCYFVTVKGRLGTSQYARIGSYISAPGPHFSPRDDGGAIISIMQIHASEVTGMPRR